MNSQGSGAFSNIIAGLQWVQSYVRAQGIRSAVVNLSVGGPRSASLNDAVTQLLRSNIAVVSAAGNSKADACSYSPASVSTPGMVTVGSTTSADAASSFSNFGACLSLFAPGSQVVSAGHSCDSCSSTQSGTSMAAPAVAGEKTCRTAQCTAGKRGMRPPRGWEAERGAPSLHEARGDCLGSLPFFFPLDFLPFTTSYMYIHF
jgi:subtilisin family serine protease